jgi:hypothetical protein
MARAPQLKALSQEDYKNLDEKAAELVEKLFKSLNPFLTDVTNGLSQGLTREENLKSFLQSDYVFITKAAAADTFPITFKNRLPGNVAAKSVFVTKLQKTSGAAITTAWSMTWQANNAGDIQMWLQGLDPSIPYRLSFAVEG